MEKGKRPAKHLDLPDAGFIYTGPMFQKDLWKGPDLACCRASVNDGERVSNSWQCRRKVKVEREVLFHGRPVTFGYCGQHDPVAVKARDAARSAKWRKQWDDQARRDQERQLRRELGDAAVEAIRQIAAGHNDARGLAQETLARFETETNDDRQL